MKMVLLEFKLMAVDRNFADGRDVQLNGIAIIEIMVSAYLIMDIYWLLIRLNETREIDRRLILPL